MTGKRRSNLSRISERTKKKVDELLSDREAQVLRDTSIDWKELMPENVNQEDSEKLIAIVDEARKHNESIARLKQRLQSLGAEGIALVKRLANLAESKLG